ncbi:hypothetical protein BTVI_51128 [Pitangus sulphuratus]|nr:hypothetical protein BTVI_51128 [Pitangus sulphuratus]
MSLTSPIHKLPLAQEPNFISPHVTVVTQSSLHPGNRLTHNHATGAKDPESCKELVAMGYPLLHGISKHKTAVRKSPKSVKERSGKKWGCQLSAFLCSAALPGPGSRPAKSRAWLLGGDERMRDRLLLALIAMVSSSSNTMEGCWAGASLATEFAFGQRNSWDTVGPGKFKRNLYFHPEILEQNLVWRRGPAKRHRASRSWILTFAGCEDMPGCETGHQPLQWAQQSVGMKHLLSLACMLFSWRVALDSEDILNWK